MDGNRRQYTQPEEETQAGHRDKKPLGKAIEFVIDTVKIFAMALLIALALNNLVVANMEVTSGSMEKTIMTDDRILFNRLSYIGGLSPKRYDVIVFKYPFEDNYYNENYVKRVIGLPGEKVEIIGGKVYINDSAAPLDDSFTDFKIKDDYGPYYVPEGHYFMLGDNRDSSHDSRYWVSPYIGEDRIIGKAFLRYYPNIKLM